MESNLKIYTLVDGVNTPFPDADSQVEIFDYTYTAKRMGGAPSIAATIQYATCLDDVWTENVFLEFKGEKYFLKQTPTSSLSNDNARYKHEAEFVSERIILDNVYFYDVVDANKLTDKPVSNSSKVAFFGTIEEFVGRLNKSLIYAKLQTADSLGNYLSGYRVVIDEGITSEGKLITFEDQFFSNVLQEIYKVYELPYYFDGKTIHIGFEYSTLTQTFEYGIENELLSITKTNANNKIVNRATGQGSSDNVPYYYPNMSEKGDIEPEYYTVDNNKVEVSGLRVVNAEKYANKISTGESLTYTVEDVICNYYPNGWQYVLGTGRSTTYSGNKPIQYRYLNRNSKLEISFSRKIEIGGNGFIKLPSTMTVWYDAYGTGGYTHSILDPKYIQNIRLEQRNGDVTTTHEMELYKSSTGQYAGFTNTNKLQVGFGKKADMWLCYDLILPTSAIQLKDNGTQDVRVQHTMSANVAEEYIYWLSEHNKTEYPNLGAVGIGLPSTYTPVAGDKIIQKLIKYVQPQETLMPSIYRETDGAERFYNAVNGEYKDEDNNDVVFPNPYVVGKPKEQIVSFDDIKPTIVGMTNENGQRIDKILAVAFDRNDNNETEEIDGTLHYKHPYFFVKLPKFDGPNAFNLFDNKIDESEMTLSMTSGECGGCEFTIMVSDDDLQANTVQVDNNGDLLYDDNGNVICGREKYQSAVTPQDRQNDTINNEVWIALKKDEQTFGTMLPTMTISPSIGDTFVFLHINLPQAYIEAAEDRLEKAIIEYIRDNNEEKFTFSIKFSRIFLAENPNIESQINENALLHIVYNGYTYPLYVSSYSYKVNSSDALPEITVELADKLAVSQNAIQTAISEVKGDFLESFNNIDFLGLGRSYFMRKDVDDRSAGKIAASLGFEAGGYNKGISGAIIDEVGNAEFGALKVRDKIEAEIISTPNFVQGLVGGSGGRLWVDENGNANLEVDNIIARQSLSVMQLSIKEVDSVGGMLVVSSSNGEIVGVAESDDATQYYIELAEGQMFKAGDLIRCSAWDATNNVLKSYWVEFHPTDENGNSVSSSSVGWVSKSEFNDNIIPSVGDKLVQMGNTTDTLRQGVIVITSVDNKPNISIYDGVDSASFDGKLTTRLGDLSGVSFNGKDLSGYGLWGENVHLHGDLILSSTNKSVADSLKDVGNGRNLLLGTNRGVENWLLSTSLDKGKYSMLGIDKNGAKGIQVVKRTTEESSWGEVLMFPLRPQFITKNKTYHISFDLMQSANQKVGMTINLFLTTQNGSINNALNNIIKVKSIDVNGVWQHHDYEFTAIRSGSETSGQLIYFGITKQNNPDGWVDFAIANLKLEEGVKATEWTSAPEDAQDEYDHLAELANNAQITADNAQSLADEAKSNAYLAQSSANAAKERLDAWAEDGVISPNEKQGLKDELTRIEGDYKDIIDRFDRASLDSPSGYIEAYNAYTDMLSYLINESAISGKETTDIPEDFAEIQENYYQQKVNAYYDLYDSSLTSAENAQSTADTIAQTTATLTQDIININNRLDGVVENWFYKGYPTPQNAPAIEWTNAQEKYNHIGDTFTSIDENGDYAGKSWRWIGVTAEPSFEIDFTTGSINGVTYYFYWQTIADSDAIKALRQAQEAQDTADGKRRVFVAQPTPPYDEGDLWVNTTENGVTTIYYCVTPKADGGVFSNDDWQLAATDNSALQAFIDGNFKGEISNLKAQIDKKAETWYQSTDPSSQWHTDDLKNLHIGDMWYNTNNNTTHRWNGSLWEEQNIPKSVFDTIDGKAQIFVTTPTPPYNIGDLWVQGESGDIMRCKAGRSSGNYNPNDWEKASKYTDDTALNDYKTIVSKEFTATDGKFTSMQTKIAEQDGKIEANTSLIQQTADNISLTIKSLTWDNQNLLLNSAKVINDRNYLLGFYDLGDFKPINNSKVTLSFSGYLGNGHGMFKIYNSGYQTQITTLNVSDYNTTTQRYEKTFDWVIGNTENTYINIFQADINGNAITDYGDASIVASKIYNIKLEFSSKATSWTPAPEDTNQALKDTGIDIKSKKITVTADNFQVQNNEGDPTLSVDENGNLVTNTLQAVNQNQNPLISANVNNSGFLVFYYPHKKGQRQMEMGWDAESQSLMRYYDEDDNMLWKIGNASAFVKPDYTEWTTLSLYKVLEGGTEALESAKNVAKQHNPFNMSYYYQHNNVGSNNVVYVQKDIYSEKINGWFTPHASPQPFDTEMSGLVYRSLRHYTNGIPDYYVPDNEMTFPIN